MRYQQRNAQCPGNVVGRKNRLHRKNAEGIENRKSGKYPQVAMNCKSQLGLAWYSDCIFSRRSGKTWNVLNRFSCVIARPSPALCAITFLSSLVPIFHGLPWRFHKQAGEFSMMEWLHAVGNRGLSPIVILSPIARCMAYWLCATPIHRPAARNSRSSASCVMVKNNEII